MGMMYHNKGCNEQKNLILEKTSTSVEISQEQEQQEDEYMPSEFL